MDALLPFLVVTSTLSPRISSLDSGEQPKRVRSYPSRLQPAGNGPWRGSANFTGFLLGAAVGVKVLKMRKAKQNEQLRIDHIVRCSAQRLPLNSLQASINTLTFSVICCIYCLSFLGYSIALPLGPALIARQINVGTFTSTFFLGQLLGNVSLPMIARKLGIKPVLVGSLLTAAAAWCFLGAALQVASSHQWMLLLARSVAGFGSGSVPVLKSFLVESLPEQRQLSAHLAYGEAASQIAFSFGPLLGGALADSSAIGGGIFVPFYCIAVLCGAAAIITATAFSQENSPAGVQGQPGQGKYMEAVVKTTRHEAGNQWWQQWQAMRAVGMSLVFSLVRFVVNPCIPFLLLRRYHLSTSGLGAALAVLSTFICALQVLVFKPVEGWLGVKRTCGAGVLCCSAALMTMGVQPSQTALALTIYAVGVALAVAALPGSVASSCDEQLRSNFLTLEAVVSSFARIIAPLALSFLLVEPRALHALAILLLAATPLLS